MKPKKLIVCGWGPYKDKQEIDFEQLNERGLFLVSGPTGAGKTTLFDAITYALYGNMSGMVREKNSVRSDFAGEDMPTYVELWMTHDGKDYHIYRNPEYLRPKKRKTGNCDMTKEKERAVLTLEDGSKVEGASEVTGKIQEILRLDYRQFKQLSLIAQGEFAKLMTASSSEKSKIKISPWLKMLLRLKRLEENICKLYLIKDLFQNIKRTQNETRNIENG